MQRFPVDVNTLEAPRACALPQPAAGSAPSSPSESPPPPVKSGGRKDLGRRGHKPRSLTQVIHCCSFRSWQPRVWGEEGVFHFSLLVSRPQPPRGPGAAFDISVIKRDRSHIPARSLTFETRDGICTLNPNLCPGGEFLLISGEEFVDLCLVSISISAPDVSCLPRLS